MFVGRDSAGVCRVVGGMGTGEKKVGVLIGECSKNKPILPIKGNRSWGFPLLHQSMSGKVRGYVFTVQSHDQARCDELETLAATGACTYLVYGKEVAPTTGQEHLQGYLYWRNPRAFAGTKRALPDGAHIEVAKQSADVNRTYCIKEGDFKEFGTCPAQGKRTDIDSAVAVLKESGSLKRVAEECPSVFIKYHRGLAAYRNIQRAERTKRTIGVWLWGPTGVGKTHWARELGRMAGSVYFKSGEQQKWWPNYEGQRTSVINDFRGQEWTASYILNLVDKYPFDVEIKGGYEKFTSRFVIFTGDKEPSCEFTMDDWPQVARRLSRNGRSSGENIFHLTERMDELPEAIMDIFRPEDTDSDAGSQSD